MKRTNSPTNSSRQATPSRLALIAAVLVAALLVSSLLWVLHSTRPGQIGSQPSVSHGIYLFKKDGIDKLDLQTHKVLWHLAHIYQEIVPMTPVFSPRAEVVGDNLYLLDKANTIVAINAQNGKMRWSRTFATFPPIMGSPQLTLSGGLLYVNPYVGVNGGGSVKQPKVLYGLDPANGAIKATLTLPSNSIGGGTTFDKNVLYYTNGIISHSATTKNVYAFQLPGGQPLWHISLGMKNSYTDDGPYFHNDVMYITFHLYQSHDWIYAFDRHTGKLLRKYLVPSTGDGFRYADLYFIGDMIYCPSTDGYLYALDTRTGKLVWKKALDGEITQATSNALYLHTNRSMHRAYIYTDLVALRAKDGAILWHFNSSVPSLHFGSGYTILNIGGVLYDLVTDDNGGINPHAALYAVKASDGTLLWQLPVPGQEVLVA